MSINTVEFSRTETWIYGNDIDYAQTGKFIVGIDKTFN
jgi:hypothetical protein